MPETLKPAAPASLPPAPRLSRYRRGARFALGVVLSVFLPTTALGKVVKPLD